MAEITTFQYAITIIMLVICCTALGWEMRNVAEISRREKARNKRAEMREKAVKANVMD